MRILCTSLGLVLLALPLVACGSKPADSPDASEDCSMDSRADTFVVGLDKKGQAGAFDFVLESATPAPPARNNNTWVIQVNSMSAGVVGSPVSGLAANMAATPYMPDHGHGTPIPVKITETSTPGQYQLDPVNMWMPGLWQTTIQVDNGGVTDKAVFSFCIPN
jgi:hypothetical protein